LPDLKLYMAPIRGVTDHVFRNAFAEHFGGFDLAVAPFIPSKRDNSVKKKYVRDLWPENNPAMPVIAQILSNAATDFVILANYIYDLGYQTVNWNLGCPYPMVANKKRGSGLLPHTDRIHEFLEYAIPRLKGYLSIKLRLGWQTHEDIFRLIPVLNQFPVKELIIHPRTGIQRYHGKPDLDALDQCLGQVHHPVVYNGDIRTLGDFRRLSLRFGNLDRWMIGRGAIADPFLPMTIKAGKNDVRDRAYLMKRFHDTLVDRYMVILDGPGHVLNKMKGLWQYFSLFFPDCGTALKKIKKSRTPEQYRERVEMLFDEHVEYADGMNKEEQGSTGMNIKI
jgi:tRNA-dihydrouridine synthase B